MPKPIKITTKKGVRRYKVDPIYKGRRLGAKTFDTAAEARHYERELIAQAGKGLATQKRTFCEAMEKYRLEVTPSKRGARWEDIRLLKLKRDTQLSRVMVAALAYEDFEEWIDRERDRGLKDSSILREFGILNQVCRMCRKWRWMSHNPTELVDRPKESPPRKRRISDEEYKQISAALKVEQPCESLSQEAGLSWLLAIETGMRCSEMTTLEVNQLFLTDHYLHLEKTKNGDERDVPLSPRAVELIKSLPGCGERIFKIRSSSVDPLFRRARDKLNVKNLRYHDSRHEAASRFVHGRKYELMELCAVMGWRDPKMAQDYYAPTASELASRLR